MSDYVLLYSGGKMPEPSETNRVMASWTSWLQSLGDRLVDQGNPFTPMVKSIHLSGMVEDGPIDCGVTGYSIIKADSLDAAVALARGCPVLQDGAEISVYETFNPRPNVM